MRSRVSRFLGLFLTGVSVAMVPAALLAQDAAKPDAAKPAPVVYPASKWDVFLGYSYIKPSGNVNTPLGDGTSNTIPVGYVQIPGGGILSIAYYFHKNLGVEVIGDFHLENEHPGSTWTQPGDDISGGSIGLIQRYPTGNLTPFLHALGGVDTVGGPHWQLETRGPVVTLGGGLDYATPLFSHHLSIRLIQADYQYTHEDFGPTTHSNPPPATLGTFGGIANINAIRLSAGVVFHDGSAVAPALSLTAVANPTTVFAGDPVTVTATPGNLNPKLNSIYSWSGTGATGTATSVTVATGALAPGTYTVQSQLKEGKKGKEGRKPGQLAVASASFTVKQFDPPTAACSVDPTTIRPGETAVITTTGISPQNRPLTYSYSATAGSVSGTDKTASYASAGAPSGTVGITCKVSDDKGQTATATANLTILPPYVKPIPHTRALCSISFDNDKKRPTRVDNEAKACLDEVTLALKNDPAATAVVVGEASAKEKAATAKQQKAALKNKHVVVTDAAAERAVNTKDYLVTETQSGIDKTRISTQTGTADAQAVENYLVPSEATFASDVQGTTPVNESAVKVQVRKPLAMRHAHKAAAGKKAAHKKAAHKKAAAKKKAAGK